MTLASRASRFCATMLRALRHPPMSLADGLQRERQDNFLLLRHFAAVLLIYSHCYALATSAKGRADIVAHVLPGFYGGKVAIILFFAISGFLVTSSYLRHPQLPRFITARVLRIYPAYVACLVVVVVATGLWFTRLSPADFFAHPQTRDYLLHNLQLTGLHYVLPGAYDASGYPGVANGSLWSLALEVRLYMYIAALGLCGLFRLRWLAAALLAGGVIAALFGWHLLGPDTEGKRALTCVFAATAAAACIAQWIPVSTRVLAVLCGTTWLFYETHLGYGMTIACLGYFTFWFAYRLPAIPLPLPGDYSYGLFLYGFPVQQALIQFMPDIGVLALTAAALGISLILAALSWHGIERRALDLKRTRAATVVDRKADAHGLPQKDASR